MIGAAWLETGCSAFPEREEYMWFRAAFLAGGSSQERAWHAAGKEQMRDKKVGDQVLPRAAKKSGRSTEVVSLLVAAHAFGRKFLA